MRSYPVQQHVMVLREAFRGFASERIEFYVEFKISVLVRIIDCSF